MPFPRKEKPLKRITVTVDPDDYRRMDQMARSRDVSASWLIRRAMKEFLALHRNEPLDPLTQPRARKQRG